MGTRWWTEGETLVVEDMKRSFAELGKPLNGIPARNIEQHKKNGLKITLIGDSRASLRRAKSSALKRLNDARYLNLRQSVSINLTRVLEVKFGYQTPYWLDDVTAMRLVPRTCQVIVEEKRVLIGPRSQDQEVNPKLVSEYWLKPLWHNLHKMGVVENSRLPSI